jgi:hypothetical protein
MGLNAAHLKQIECLGVTEGVGIDVTAQDAGSKA